MRKALSLICGIVAVCTAMTGCRSGKVSHYRFPDTYERLKKIEREVFTAYPIGVLGTDGECREIPPLPDYFDFRQAVEAYEGGRRKAIYSVMPAMPVALSVYSETNLTGMAARDGFEEGMVRSHDTVLKRNAMRRQRQREFWGVYRDGMGLHDSLTMEEESIATNCYAHLLSSYARGYRNGYQVVARIGKSPISTRHCLAHADLGANALRRAYVYGWYSACHDYFNVNQRLPHAEGVPSDGSPRSFYVFWLSFYMDLEREFLRENAARKETVRDMVKCGVR